LPEIFDFTSATFAARKIDPRLLPAVDFTVEELFTNMVKYSKIGGAAVDFALTPIEGGVEVTLTDHDVEEFDVTLAPDVDVNLRIEQRTPGGLGLHLIRRMVDSIAYQYIEHGRQSHITFRKTLTGKTAAGGAPITRGENADN
jgi:serine/threonine-protein kinase RsbW